MISVLPLHERKCKIFHIYTVDQNSTLIEFNKKNWRSERFILVDTRLSKIVAVTNFDF